MKTIKSKSRISKLTLAVLAFTNTLLLIPSLAHAQSASQIALSENSSPDAQGLLEFFTFVYSVSKAVASNQPAATPAQPVYRFNDNVCRVYDSSGFLGQVYYTADGQLRIEDQNGKNTTTPDPLAAVIHKGFEWFAGIGFEGAACKSIDAKAGDAFRAGVFDMYSRQALYLAASATKPDFFARRVIDSNTLNPNVADSIKKNETSIGTGGAPLENSESNNAK